MSIKEVLNTSYKLAYGEHVSRLLSIPEKYLSEIKPNKKIPYSEIFKSYNSEVVQELNDFGDTLTSETRRVLAEKNVISPLDKNEIEDIIESYLKSELYTKRFDIFIDSIGRTLSRYGLAFEPEEYRVDISRSLAEVNSKNTCRKIQVKILNETDILMLRNESNKPQTGAYGFLNNLYNNHQLVFWGVGLVISVMLGTLFV